MIDFERRPETRPSITYPSGMPLDPHPYRTRQGRLIPGYEHSLEEFERLLKLADAAQDTEQDILPIMPLPTTKQLARVALNAITGCWELPVYDDPKPRARYGSLSVNGIPGSMAHRTMYQVLHGTDSVTERDNVDHLCENKACCYPRHLEVVSSRENTRRGRVRAVRDQVLLFDKH